jgi:hypothetical protein
VKREGVEVGEVSEQEHLNRNRVCRASNRSLREFEDCVHRSRGNGREGLMSGKEPTKAQPVGRNTANVSSETGRSTAPVGVKTVFTVSSWDAGIVGAERSGRGRLLGRRRGRVHRRLGVFPLPVMKDGTGLFGSAMLGSEALLDRRLD